MCIDLSCILFAGILGHAEPAPVAQPAAASMAAPSGEPQLTPKGTGGSRGWGPSHFEAAPAAAPVDAAACSRMAAAGTPCASAALQVSLHSARLLDWHTYSRSGILYSAVRNINPVFT